MSNKEKNTITALGKIMEDRNLTAAELARQSGVDPSMISRLTHAKQNDIFISKDAVPIAAALKLPVAEVFPEFFKTMRRRRQSPRRANSQVSIA